MSTPARDGAGAPGASGARGAGPETAASLNPLGSRPTVLLFGGAGPRRHRGAACAPGTSADR